MRFFDDVSLPGHGTITGAFYDTGRRFLAVSSSFRLLTEPRARAAYGGQWLRHRLALYCPPATSQIALFDRATLPINHVAYHPSKPIVAVGGGSYDGGYLFEGQLVLWNWETGELWSAAERIPEVLRVKFSDDGSTINALVRPWNEDLDAPGGESFLIAFEIELPTDAALAGGVDGNEIDRQIIGTAAVSLEKLAVDDRRLVPTDEIKRAFGFDELRARSPIWDIAFLGSDEIAVVHDDCRLELCTRDGGGKRSLVGTGHGAQIFAGRRPLIHVSHFDWGGRTPSVTSDLMTLDGAGLSLVTTLKGAYTFSVSQDGLVLGRRDRSFGPEGTERLDVILDPEAGTENWLDAGRYDVFNHYLRVDSAPYLFFVQGTPSNSHEHKYLCIVSPVGEVSRLWPLLPDNGDQASHAMECSYCYVRDDAGEGMIVAGRHFSSSPATSYRGFIYRRNLTGDHELWRHETTASATSIKVIPERGIVLAAFLDGRIGVFRARDGHVHTWNEFKPDGYPNIAFSLDIDDLHVLVGLLDGRYGLLDIEELCGN